MKFHYEIPFWNFILKFGIYPLHFTMVCMVELEPGVLKPGESNLYLLNPYPGSYPALQAGQYTHQILTFKVQRRRLKGNSANGC